MNNLLRDSLVDVIIEQLGFLNLTDKLNLSEIRGIADEMLVEDTLIKEIPDIIIKKIKVVIDSKEPFIHCDMCADTIRLGDDMFVMDDKYFDTVQCLLQFLGVHETLLEPCFFDNDKESE